MPNYELSDEDKKQLHGGMMNKKMHDSGEIRTFGTGATRDTAEGKLDYEGFLSPLVLKRYAEFMNENRKQSDGELRDSDNWQKGIPKEVYMKSMWRHFMEVWSFHRKGMVVGVIEIALCALLFNVSGMLHEILKEKERANEDLHKMQE